ncbi:MAG: TPM domain-containing protein [Helicobacteraceae bacterium]|nr:TPM domain-containing protein [Helicobacteraceae bacterium]
MIIYFKKILLFCGILFHFCYANTLENNFVFNDDLVFVEKSVDFVEKTSKELFTKTGVSLYVYMTDSMSGAHYNEFKNKIISNFKAPYVAIILVKNDKKIDIATSSDDLIDKKKVYWEYMVPLLPSKDSEITNQVLSAVVLNGYIESVDLIADKFKVKIEHNIPKDEKGAKAVAQLILYIMLFSMLGLFFVFYFYKRKGSK